MDLVLTLLTWIAALGSALVAGVFFAFSAFVMRALGERPPAEAIAAMQAINVVVVRSPFIAAFVGTAAVSALLAVAAIFDVGDARALAWLAGGALYVGGTFGLTLLRNVPLNDALAAAVPGTPDATALWDRYRVAWTRWNTIRTVASLAATAAYIEALR